MESAKKLCSQETDLGIKPYTFPTPEHARDRPTTESISRPKTKEEIEYCWFYWLDLLGTDTRWVLDNLERQPEFSVPWGPHHRLGDKLHEKRL